jgi:hypothetical protein
MYLNGDLGLRKLEGLLERGCVVIRQPSLDECMTCGPDMAMICVIDNGLFDAAAYIDSRYDYEGCTDPQDLRPKTWLLADVSMLKGLM